MTELPDNILHLPQYQVLGCKSTDDEMHFQVDVPDPIACEECGVQGEFVRFGKRDVPYRDLPIHGKRVTLWVVRRRYTCRACKTTFRPQLPEMVDGFRMTLRLHEYVEKESFNHPYTFVAAQTGLDEKTVRDIFNARAEFLGRWHRFETPRILGIDPPRFPLGIRAFGDVERDQPLVMARQNRPLAIGRRIVCQELESEPPLRIGGPGDQRQLEPEQRIEKAALGEFDPLPVLQVLRYREIGDRQIVAASQTEAAFIAVFHQPVAAAQGGIRARPHDIRSHLTLFEHLGTGHVERDHVEVAGAEGEA